MSNSHKVPPPGAIYIEVDIISIEQPQSSQQRHDPCIRLPLL